MTDTNYAASLTKFAAEHKTTLENAAAVLNAAKGSKLPGTFRPANRAGAMQPDALVTLEYFENDSSAEGYRHCVNFSERSIYGNAPGTVCASITMVSRSGGNKNYKEYRLEGGVLAMADAKKIVSQVKSKRAKFLKNIAASVAYAEGPHYRSNVLGTETVAHFKAILRAMGA